MYYMFTMYMITATYLLHRDVFTLPRGSTFVCHQSTFGSLTEGKKSEQSYPAAVHEGHSNKGHELY